MLRFGEDGDPEIRGWKVDALRARRLSLPRAQSKGAVTAIKSIRASQVAEKLRWDVDVRKGTTSEPALSAVEGVP